MQYIYDGIRTRPNRIKQYKNRFPEKTQSMIDLINFVIDNPLFPCQLLFPYAFAKLNYLASVLRANISPSVAPSEAVHVFLPKSIFVFPLKWVVISGHALSA